ncbi:MAG: glutamate 5-kinase [Verrucomicrobiales bacterium]|jgi:glutamate 5-kinase|nr:glutamate 5-kinase [Verrucomicrobiales bacterium]MBP9223746.1 glutamate 5-kinase [Verrucomicrobiales bacterium]
MATAFTGKRIVIKIGTGVLTRNAGGEIHHAMIARLSQAIADINAAGHEVIMVSSGAVGAGMSAFCLTERPTETNMLQACAAAGQARLMHLYEGQFGLHGLKVAQLLVTHEDLQDERRSGNVLATLNAILPHRQVIPIMNENDSVSVYELKVGDNDTLSSIVARLAGADMLILLTSVAGLMGPDAKSGDDIIPLVDDIESVLSFVRDEKGALSVGGMASKLRAVEAAVSAGIETLIASGLQPEQLPELVEGRGIATRFVPKLAKNP